MPTKIKSRKGKTAIKTRRGKPRLKRGVDVEEGASGRKSDRDPTEADALWSSLASVVPLLCADAGQRNSPPDDRV